MSKNRKHAEQAAVHMANLFTWDSLVSILESSSAPRGRADQRAAAHVMKICRAQVHRNLIAYDREVAKVSGIGD